MCRQLFHHLGLSLTLPYTRQQLTAVILSPNHFLNPSTASPLPGARAPATAGTNAELLVYIYFYHRTLSALQNDELPTLEPGTRSRISARFMAPGRETPRDRRGGAPRAGGCRPRPADDVCAEPLRLEGSPGTRGVPVLGAGPSQNGTCLGGGTGRKIRAGRGTVNYFRFGWTRVCIREAVCIERNY